MSSFLVFVCVMVVLGVATVVGLVGWWRGLARLTWRGMRSHRLLLTAFAVAELAVWCVTAVTWQGDGMAAVAIVLLLLLVAAAGALVGWCLHPPITTPARGVLAATGAGLIVFEINMLVSGLYLTLGGWVFHWFVLAPEDWLTAMGEDWLGVLVLGAPLGALLGSAGALLARLIALASPHDGNARRPSAGAGATQRTSGQR